MPPRRAVRSKKEKKVHAQETPVPHKKHHKKIWGKSTAEWQYSHDLFELANYVVFLLLFFGWLYMYASADKFYASLQLDTALDGEWAPKKQFGTTLSNAEAFRWLEEIVVPSLYPVTNSSTDEYILDDGGMRVGATRLRQLRVKHDKACMIDSQFKLVIDECVAPYDYFRHDDLVEKSEHVGTKYEDDHFQPYYSVQHANWYFNAGHSVYFHERESALAKLAELREGTWLDKQTRALLLDFTIFQPDTEMISFARYALYYSAAGDITPERFLLHTSLRDLVVVNDTATNTAYLCMQVLLYAFVVLKLIFALRSAYKVKGYMRDMYNRFELGNLTTFAISIFIRVNTTVRFETAVKNFKDDSEKDVAAYFETAPTRQNLVWSDRITAFNTLLIIFCIFKYARFDKKLTLPVEVLSLSLRRVTSIMVVIGLLMVGYGLAFHLMYGYALANYRTFFDSLLTLTKALFGDMDFEELTLINRYLGPALFISYSAIMFVIILSMFFSMVASAQEDLQQQLEDEMDEGGSTPDLICDMAHIALLVLKRAEKVPGLREIIPSGNRLKVLESEKNSRRYDVDDEDDEEHVKDTNALAVAPERKNPTVEEFDHAIANPKLVVLEALSTLQHGQDLLITRMGAKLEKLNNPGSASSLESINSNSSLADPTTEDPVPSAASYG